MTRQMARRRLVQWPDGSYYIEAGDRTLLELVDRDHNSPALTRRERIRLVFGYSVATLAVIGFCVLIALAGHS